MDERVGSSSSASRFCRQLRPPPRLRRRRTRESRAVATGEQARTELVVGPMTNPEIPEALVRNPKNVETRSRNLFRTMDVPPRVEFAPAAEAGLRP
jgi:DNA-binding NarL/FixJ family response regulator